MACQSYIFRMSLSSEELAAKLDLLQGQRAGVVQSLGRVIAELRVEVNSAALAILRTRRRNYVLQREQLDTEIAAVKAELSPRMGLPESSYK